MVAPAKPRVPRTQFSFKREGEVVVVRGKSPCGQDFELGTLFEPDSPNSVISLDNAFGIVGLAELAEQYFRWRAAA